MSQQGFHARLRRGTGRINVINQENFGSPQILWPNVSNVLPHLFPSLRGQIALLRLNAFFQIAGERQTEALAHGLNLIETAFFVMAFRRRGRNQNVRAETKVKPKSVISEKDVLQFIIPAAFELVKQCADGRVVEINRQTRNRADLPPEKDRLHLREAIRTQQLGSLRKEKEGSRPNRFKAHLAKRCCSNEFP